MTSLTAFYDMLERHDWTYEYSDDPGAWHEGRDQHERLRAIAAETPDHKALFESMQQHYLAEPGQKPEKPVKPQQETT